MKTSCSKLYTTDSPWHPIDLLLREANLKCCDLCRSQRFSHLDMTNDIDKYLKKACPKTRYRNIWGKIMRRPTMNMLNGELSETLGNFFGFTYKVNSVDLYFILLLGAYKFTKIYSDILCMYVFQWTSPHVFSKKHSLVTRGPCKSPNYINQLTVLLL